MAYPLWSDLRHFSLFAGIGAIGTGAHYLSLIVLVELALLSPVLATTIGALIGMLINYVLNYRITFNSNKPHHIALSQFFIVALAGAAINVGLMYAGVHWLNWHYLLVQILATLIVLFWNYLLNRLWTFAQTTNTRET